MSWIDTRPTRLAVVGLLLVGLAVACVGFAMLEPAPGANRYPTTVDILDDSDEYLGERVVVSGTVVRTAPVRIVDEETIVRDGTVVTRAVRYTITGRLRAVDQRQSIQVFGTLTGVRAVRARNVVVVPGRNFLYMYGVSFLAGLWVLGRLLRGWRLDWGGLCLEPRDQPRTLGTILTPWLEREED